MPYKTTPLKGGKVRVTSPHGVKAKSTTPAKAAAQERLLRGVEHGWKPDAARHALKKKVMGGY
jgi:hypothetical protein